MTEIHADRPETVARQRYYQNENLHGGDPIREIRSVILEVVQLFLHVRFLGHALSERPPAIAKRYPRYPLCVLVESYFHVIFFFKYFFYHAIIIK